FPDEIKKLSRKQAKPYVIFFEASDDVLQRRFSETRRPHPTGTGKSLMASIRAERKALEPIRKIADLIIDTSDHTVHTLRKMLVEQFSAKPEGTPLRI
ncbi:MAG: RNase adaptor protein RapZ, partial [Blastocatellia bacterium]